MYVFWGVLAKKKTQNWMPGQVLCAYPSKHETHLDTSLSVWGTRIKMTQLWIPIYLFWGILKTQEMHLETS